MPHNGGATPQNRRMFVTRFFAPGLMLPLVAALSACSAGEKDVEAPAPGRQEVALGQKLLAQYQCGSCHAIPGVPAAGGRVASSLSQFGQRSYIAGRIPNRPELLAQWIAQPASLVPGTAMPAMGVAPAEADAMAAYLHSLK